MIDDHVMNYKFIGEKSMFVRVFWLSLQYAMKAYVVTGDNSVEIILNIIIRDRNLLLRKKYVSALLFCPLADFLLCSALLCSKINVSACFFVDSAGLENVKTGISALVFAFLLSEILRVGHDQ